MELVAACKLGLYTHQAYGCIEATVSMEHCNQEGVYRAAFGMVTKGMVTKGVAAKGCQQRVWICIVMYRYV